MTTKGWVKPVVWVLLFAPLAWLGYLISLDLATPNSALGADPGETVVHFLGEWALRILLLAFSVTPLFKLTRWPAVARCRRLVGLWAFAYVVLHLTMYLYFYLQFSWAALLADFVERAYITAGLVAAILLLVMAFTSTRGWRLRLGQNWRRLHLAIYPAIAAAIIHFLWLTRDQFGEVLAYTLWFAILLGLRGYYRFYDPLRRARTA